MNIKSVISVIKKALILEGVLMIIPMLIGVFNKEDTLFVFLIPILGLFAIGGLLFIVKNDRPTIYAKEGFVIVALVWVLLSVFGALPFVISRQIPNYIDALFETVSGFSTTGASILNDVSVLSKSVMFWRIFTHFLGGMGVLVFVLAILPSQNDGAMYIFKAESPGPSASKIVGKIRKTAGILYIIYIILTFLEFIMLLFSKIGVYDSLLTAFSTAGTGGFSVRNGSIAYYNNKYVEIVVSVFMFLFGINFNLFYLIITGCILKAIKSEEFIVYFVIVLLSTVAIALNIMSINGGFFNSLRLSFFQVTSFASTSGFTTANFENWPSLSKAILLFLTVMGACGGSTGGGFKVSRLCILIKSGGSDLRKVINDKEVVSLRFEGKTVPHNVERGVRSYFILWVMIVAICTLLLSFDYNDLFTNFSATLACIGNVGPGLTSVIGASGSYSVYSYFSKIVLSIVMLAGRLEIFPLVAIFARRTWRK